MVVRPGAGPEDTMVVRPATSWSPDATMALPRPAADPNATMVVPSGGSHRTTSAAGDAEAPAGAVSAAAGNDPDEPETGIELLEELTGNRARTDDEEPPDGYDLGSRS